jgi:hypothetical protein
MKMKILAILLMIPFTFAFSGSVDLWYGGQFNGFAWDDVMVVAPGEWVNIPVYALSQNDDVVVADMMVPLGINKAYIDQINVENCQMYYPVSDWDVATFANENDEFQEGWSSLSFMGFSQIFSEDSPYGYFEVPTKIMSFNVHIIEDEALLNQVVMDAIGSGSDPRQGAANMGSISGDENFQINEHFATFLFSPVGIEDEAPVPDVYFLADNYPNPFNPTTLMKYGIPEDANVTIEVFDILGRRVSTLVNNEPQQAGYHQVYFDGDNLASGMYFFRMQAGDFHDTKKMMLLK